MQIELLHPVHHGVGKGKTIEFGRGVYQTDNSKAKAYIPPELAEELLQLQSQAAPEGIARLYKPREAAAPPEGKAQVMQQKR
jgi:hypothetical protein